MPITGQYPRWACILSVDSLRSVCCPVSDTGEIINSFDFWLFGTDSLAFWRASKYNFYADCECGSIFLWSLAWLRV